VGGQPKTTIVASIVYVPKKVVTKEPLDLHLRFFFGGNFGSTQITVHFIFSRSLFRRFHQRQKVDAVQDGPSLQTVAVDGTLPVRLDVSSTVAAPPALSRPTKKPKLDLSIVERPEPSSTLSTVPPPPAVPEPNALLKQPEEGPGSGQVNGFVNSLVGEPMFMIPGLDISSSHDVHMAEVGEQVEANGSELDKDFVGAFKAEVRRLKDAPSILSWSFHIVLVHCPRCNPRSVFIS
jgi:hypothetical protein